MPETLDVLSGGGGRHLYFQLPTGTPKIRTKFATGIEALADGFYVVAPTSLHPSGRTYEWEISSVDLPPAVLPDAWLQRMCEQPVKSKQSSTGKTQIPEGERNVDGPQGKRIIATEPETAPLVVKLFEWYSTGEYSLKEVTGRAKEAGLRFRRS